MWATGLGLLLAMFYVADTFNFRRAPKPVREQETAHEQWRFDGLNNLFFLAVILGAVFIERYLFLREGLILAAAIGSYFTTKKSVHEANDFNFHPIQEVAILFIGIFATMMPALDWLAANAQSLLGTHPAPGFFYWGTGSLSSVLDNAPTYLAFLSAVFGSFVDADIVTQVQHLIQTGGTDLATYIHGEHAEAIKNTFLTLQKYHGDHVLAKGVGVDEIKICFLLGNVAFNNYILAISVGAVFFGACTYIGNGPNFMVKSIADHQKVHTPTFVGFIVRYTLPYLLPMLVVVWWVFFRK
jgi:Na+/H+ antiporter NhaD/arsenite permease-like protein